MGKFGILLSTVSVLAILFAGCTAGPGGLADYSFAGYDLPQGYSFPPAKDIQGRPIGQTENPGTFDVKAPEWIYQGIYATEGYSAILMSEATGTTIGSIAFRLERPLTEEQKMEWCSHSTATWIDGEVMFWINGQSDSGTLGKDLLTKIQSRTGAEKLCQGTVISV